MVFFDIDGTLVDHEGAERAAAVAFQKEHAETFPGSTEEFVRRWHIVAEKHVRRYLTGELTFQDQRRARMRELFALRGPLTDTEADSVFARYLQRYEENWRLFGDVESCLGDLAKDGLGIISNGDSRQQRAKLRVLGIAERFSTVIISGAIGIAKPETGIFVAACRGAGQRPDECVYVGDDYQVDALGSQRAGMRAIWLNRTCRDCAHATEMIKTLVELKKQIRGHNQALQPTSLPRRGRAIMFGLRTTMTG